MKVDARPFEALLAKAGKVAVISHVNPDGDAIGSATALFHHLTKMGLDARVILPSDYQYNLGFLDPKGDKSIVVGQNDPALAAEVISAADLLICIDLNNLDRTACLKDLILASEAPRILIDHHLYPVRESFDLVYSDIDVSSACELLFWLMMNMESVGGDVSRIGMKTARSLYAGMMTDTNNFSNSVFPTTFEMASKLIARGIDKTAIQDKVLNSYASNRIKLMGWMLHDRLTFIPGCRAAYMVLDNKTKERYSYRPGDSEGFVNIPLAVKNVKLSALFTEDDSGEFVRCSFRSKGDIDVNALCKSYFNGGGHKNASGGRLYIPVEDVPAYLEEALKKFFKA